MNNKGIAVAGTILVDKINEIDAYPKAGELTKIKSQAMSVGGCVPNVSIDLRLIDEDIDVVAVGRVGDDDEGNFVINTLKENGALTFGVQKSDDKTGFTDVMSVVGGERTFFTYSGANSSLSADDFDFDRLSVKMLHLGYFLLLDRIDNGDGLEILKAAKKKGIKTSIDLVSENSDRYKLILPCLQYVDNLIINEVEAGKLADIEPTYENIPKIAERLKGCGVNERVIIHAPEFGVCLSNERFTVIPSYDLPKGFIKGTTGAGDAFCAGCLIGIYKEESDEEILTFASMCAAAALSEADAVSGLGSRKEIKELCKNFERRKI